MENRVHFFSINDMSIPSNLAQADIVIKGYKEGKRPKDVNDIIELHNIWLFVDKNIYKTDWNEDTLQLIRQDFKNQVVCYFSNLERDSWVEIYQQIKFEYKEFFWDIIDRFNIDRPFDYNTLCKVFDENPYDLSHLLRHERLVDKHTKDVATLIKRNEHAAEWLLQEYVEEDKLNSYDKLFFPQSLTYKDKEEIILHYLDGNNPNLNYVRLILLAKNDSNLRLSDNIRLKAKRLERTLNEKILKSGSISHKYSVSIMDAPGKLFNLVDYDEDGNPILCYSKRLIKQCPDEELLHYIRYIFDFLTPLGLIPFVLKISESDVLERIIGLQGKYEYKSKPPIKYV